MEDPGTTLCTSPGCCGVSVLVLPPLPAPHSPRPAVSHMLTRTPAGSPALAQRSPRPHSTAGLQTRDHPGVLALTPPLRRGTPKEALGAKGSRLSLITSTEQQVMAASLQKPVRHSGFLLTDASGLALGGDPE